MKIKSLLALIACALLATSVNIHAAPRSANRRSVQIHAMSQNKDRRIMMIRELMSTKEGKQEMARMLAHDDEFRSFYETHALNPG